jgi:mono/diheme cytochrome c family protein
MYRQCDSRGFRAASKGFVLAALIIASLMGRPDVLTAQRAGAKPAPSKAAKGSSSLPVDGKRVFITICATCHQLNGEGVAEKYPPLAGSEWVADDEGKLVRVILHGVTGPIEVAGETMDGLMPPWGGTLKDAQIAAVATYVRSAWGNRAAPVNASSVTAIRAATKSRKTPWTAAELARIATVVK